MNCESLLILPHVQELAVGTTRLQITGRKKLLFWQIQAQMLLVFISFELCHVVCFFVAGCV